MRSPLDRGRVAAGEGTVGTFLGLASPAAAEVCAAAGPDWLVLDLEHGGGEEQIAPTVLADALGAELAAARTGGSRGGGG